MNYYMYNDTCGERYLHDTYIYILVCDLSCQLQTTKVPLKYFVPGTK